MWPSWCENFRLQRKKENKITTIICLNFPGQKVLKQRGWKNHSCGDDNAKMLAFSEKGQLGSWERLQLWLCSSVPQDGGWRKPSFVCGRRPHRQFSCSQRWEKADSGSSLSQECSAIWEVSMWGQRTACVTLHQQTHSKPEHSHAWSQKHHSIWRIPSCYHHP